LWRQRLLTERLMKNITALQEHVLNYVFSLIAGGQEQFTHGEIVAATGIKVGTVKDALRRARGIGLIDWRQDWRPGPNGSRRQVANVYRSSMPQRSPEPRPDLRRRSSLKSKDPQRKNVQPTWSPRCGERAPLPRELAWRPPPGFEARFAAKLTEEKK